MDQLHQKAIPVIIALSAMMLFSCSNKLEDPVQLESGMVFGIPLPDSPVRAYKGIPFADPPLGEFRWRPPQPPSSWDGVLSADTDPPACMQNAARSRLPWTEEFMHQGDVSEDCLYLNVWTAAELTTERRPVMVYIYGGGFNEGSNAIDVYDGESLAQKGVVLVTVNYRVGLLGFLAHPALTAESEHSASGNYGLLDQVAALAWVQNNIEAFGGDPDNVTIFGQSAGAMSTNLLMQSPLTRGLFDRAIILSGPGLFPSAMLGGRTLLEEGEEAGLVVADSLGAASLEELRAMPAERFLVQGLGRARPIVDGWFMPAENPHDSEVPVVNGFTANDIGMAGSFGPPTENTVSAWENEAREQFGGMADEFLSLYPAASDEEVADLRTESGRDRARVSLNLWAQRQTELSEVVYTYYFDRAIPWPEHPEFGAFHTGEIPYVFNNLSKLDRPWEPVDHTIADRVSSYWTNFGTDGDPNGEELPRWDNMTTWPDATMRLGVEMERMPLADAERLDFWRRVIMQ